MAVAQDAGIRVAGWGRVIWNVLTFDGETLGTGTMTSWGGSHREGLSIIGSSEHIGFEVDLCGENIAPNDGAFVWAKPWDWLRIDIGRVRDDTLAGDACFGTWNWNRAQNTVGENFIFERGNYGVDTWFNGGLVRITPCDWVYIGAGVEAPISDWGNNRAGDFVEQFGHRSYVEVAFTFGDVGKLKVSLKGQDRAQDDEGDWHNPAKIGAAFDLTVVENMYLGIGAKINTGKLVGKDVAEVNAYWRMSFDPVTVHALFGTKICQWNGEDDWDDFGWLAGVGLDVDLGNGLGLNIDARLQNDVYGTHAGEDGENESIDVSFLVGLYKGFSNGKLSVGFQGGINSALTDKVMVNGTNGIGSDEFQFAVPIMIEYWF